MSSRLLALLLWAPALAASQPAASYLPLDVGNRWTYAYVVRPPSAPADTVLGEPRVITTTETIGDTTYTAVSYPAQIATLHREDADGRIWARLGDRDVLLFDVTQADGDTYTVPDPYASEGGLDYVVTVRRDVPIDAVMGRFTGALTFVFDIPEVFDDEAWFALVPGVGVVAAGSGWGPTQSLYAADVAGRVVTSADEEPGSHVLVAAAPNPFASRTTLRLPAGLPETATVTVHDLLGRHLATLLDGPAGPSSLDLVWDAADWPAGVYLARIEFRGRVQTLRLVKAR